MMKTNLTILINLFFLSTLMCQVVTDSEGELQLYGVVDKSELLKTPFTEWYHKNQEDYTSTLTTADGKLLKDVKVKAFFGSWCGDTKYLLPKFMEAWQSMGLAEDQVELIAVHLDSTLYKQGPNQETIGYNIHKVPTFVFEKDGKEIGRIVERTVFDLDTDISLIAKQKPYKHRYQSVTLIDELLKDVSADSLSSENFLGDAYSLVRREVTASHELGILAYILRIQGENDKAKFVYQLNNKLYEYDPWCKSIYGKMLLDTGDLEGAQKQYYEALRIKQEDPFIIKRLSQINEKLNDKSSD